MFLFNSQNVNNLYREDNLILNNKLLRKVEKISFIKKKKKKRNMKKLFKRSTLRYFHFNNSKLLIRKKKKIEKQIKICL